MMDLEEVIAAHAAEVARLEARAARWKRVAKAFWNRSQAQTKDWCVGFDEGRELGHQETAEARSWWRVSFNLYENEYRAALDNLTSTQARCTELLLEVRRLKAALEYLHTQKAAYPILHVLLKEAIGQ